MSVKRGLLHSGKTIHHICLKRKFLGKYLGVRKNGVRSLVSYVPSKERSRLYISLGIVREGVCCSWSCSGAHVH